MQSVRFISVETFRFWKEKLNQIFPSTHQAPKPVEFISVLQPQAQVWRDVGHCLQVAKNESKDTKKVGLIKNYNLHKPQARNTLSISTWQNKKQNILCCSDSGRGHHCQGSIGLGLWLSHILKGCTCQAPLERHVLHPCPVGWGETSGQVLEG